LTAEVDIRPFQWDKQEVKVMSKVVKKKTAGGLIVEKYRPRMNKLTPAQRRQLRDQAMRIAFGHSKGENGRVADVSFGFISLV